MAKYKHLTLSERVEIYTLLKANKSIRMDNSQGNRQKKEKIVDKKFK